MRYQKWVLCFVSQHQESRQQLDRLLKITAVPECWRLIEPNSRLPEAHSSACGMAEGRLRHRQHCCPAPQGQ